MLLQRFGIPGILAALLLAIWAIGFIVFGVHDGLFHLLFLAGVVLGVAQWVRRVAA